MAQTHRDPTTPAPGLQALPASPRKRGRPKKVNMPPLPDMNMTQSERELFDFWMNDFREQYPDLTGTDNIILFMAGIEMIKYFRVMAQELDTNTVLSMARQHPGTNMRALLDQLSVTRKARTTGKKPEENADERDIKDFFLGMSRKA